MMKLASTYYHIKESKKRIVVNQGGTRSGKTYSIILALIEFCYHNTGQVITIARKTFPALRATAMRDFFELLNNEGIYNPDFHNKSEATYKLWGNLIEFISVDQPAKVRGRKRDLLFVNEITECSLEDWRQLVLRTTGKIVVDYNPADEFHWVYDHILDRDDVEFHQTTYLDNPFLEQSVVDEIERLKDVDENYWRVYGLGERGQNKATIFNHHKTVATIPTDFKLHSYGMDFGYTNSPTAIVAIYSDGEGYCIDQICYGTGMSNADISRLLQNRIEGRPPIIADCAEPKSIAEIHSHGHNIHPCRKGKDSVRSGVSYIQSKPLLITEQSVDILKELRNYKWREDKNGNMINEPVDAFNHAIDAMRYAITFNQSRPNFGAYTLG
tara:strand:- start:1103 stop:2254 length:1152 start_codon:yes stop_codon:yes gene_type:complete